MRSKRLKSLMLEADRAWSQAVRTRYGGRCAYCGKEGSDPHHLFSRNHLATRWEVDDGVFLCRMCHSYVAHGKPVKFLGWAMEHVKAFNAMHEKSKTFFQPTEKDMEEIIMKLYEKIT